MASEIGANFVEALDAWPKQVRWVLCAADDVWIKPNASR
ncbi:MAG: hypothetical protein KatS3mg052_0465 [Candidatus Roseilinea sp.]|nr:MAG: hypothetical protein KatS3mg052_0465 [Candidatus Roseilinea sp.]